ncbi:MAG: ABC transporter ATP-binding protein [Actinomycetota bacterium]|nr:ABC transporter ATP-binding protein [Actinomycetota bacterium]
MSGPAVEVHDLVKRYGAHTAVDGLSLALPRGRILAVLGPNGAGKTTTIEICEGYRQPDAGSVRVLGYRPGSAEARSRIGVMLQDGIGGYTAARADELLALFAAYSQRPQDVGTLLERVGLSEVARTPVKRLSGGQKQRLSLAAAVVGRPELVFLDEPTAGMDPQARRSTWDLIVDLRRDGVSVVLTTHYLQEAETLADTVVVLDAGRIVAQGTPQQLVQGSGDGQLRFSCAPGLDVEDLTADLPAGARVSESSAGHYLVEGTATPALVAAITGWCARRDVLVTDISVTRRSLEDVFLDLTGHEIRA